MTKGDETLARAGIAKQIDIDDQIPVLQRSLQEAIGRGRSWKAILRRCWPRSAKWSRRCRISSRRRVPRPLRRVRSSERHHAGQGRPRRLGLRPGDGAPDRAFRRRLPAQCGRGQAAELQEMARTHRIDERLAALKAAQTQPEVARLWRVLRPGSSGRSSWPTSWWSGPHRGCGAAGRGKSSHWCDGHSHAIIPTVPTAGRSAGFTSARCRSLRSWLFS